MPIVFKNEMLVAQRNNTNKNLLYKKFINSSLYKLFLKTIISEYNFKTGIPK